MQLCPILRSICAGGQLCIPYFLILLYSNSYPTAERKHDCINKGLKFDSSFAYVRRTPLLKNDEFQVFIKHADFPFLKKYFSFTMFFYEDQDGNLYDTIHLEVLSFLEPESTLDGLKAKIDQ